MVFRATPVTGDQHVENATTYVERATSDKLIRPDWQTNMELCDVINTYPGQAKDALKILKKRLWSKNPIIQLLALSVLEALWKNCGENVFQSIVERGILDDMVKIVKKKPEIKVGKKILILIDTWKETFEKYPQYYEAYNKLKSTEVEFPSSEENRLPLFTPYEEATIKAFLQIDASQHGLSQILDAQRKVNVLIYMLYAFDPKDLEGVKQEMIVDLVDQCRSCQQCVMSIVNTTEDEELLVKSLTLNDTLMCVLAQDDDISKGAPTQAVLTIEKESSVAPLVNVIHEDDESDEDYDQLEHRSSRDRNQTATRTKSLSVASSKTEITSDSDIMDDYVSDDTYDEHKSTDHSPSHSTTTP